MLSMRVLQMARAFPRDFSRRTLSTQEKIRGWTRNCAQANDTLGIEVQFLGTPKVLKTPMVALQLNRSGRNMKREIVLLGCGDSAQQRMMRAMVSPSHISTIFVPRLAPEYVYGLPAVITKIVTSVFDAGQPNWHFGSHDSVDEAVGRDANLAFDIVGPRGLERLLRQLLGEQGLPAACRRMYRVTEIGRSGSRAGVDSKGNNVAGTGESNGTFQIFSDTRRGRLTAYGSARGCSFILESQQYRPSLRMDKLYAMGIVTPGNPDPELFRLITRTGRAEWPRGSGRIEDFSFALEQKRRSQKVVFLENSDTAAMPPNFFEDARNADLVIAEVRYSAPAEEISAKAHEIGAFARESAARTVAFFDPVGAIDVDESALDRLVGDAKRALDSDTVFCVEGLVRCCLRSDGILSKPLGGADYLGRSTVERWLEWEDPSWEPLEASLEPDETCAPSEDRPSH